MIDRKISLIAAVSSNGVIGSKGTLPWHLKKDFAWFVKNTTGKVVVMGRKNYEDIIRFTKGKPLKDRINIVLTKGQLQAEGFIVLHDIEEVLKNYPEQDIMIIGGTQIYEAFLPYANQFILTEIEKDFEGDTFFPIWNKNNYTLSYLSQEVENELHYNFCIYNLIK